MVGNERRISPSLRSNTAAPAAAPLRWGSPNVIAVNARRCENFGFRIALAADYGSTLAIEHASGLARSTPEVPGSTHRATAGAHRPRALSEEPHCRREQLGRHCSK